MRWLDLNCLKFHSSLNTPVFKKAGLCVRVWSDCCLKPIIMACVFNFYIFFIYVHNLLAHLYKKTLMMIFPSLLFPPLKSNSFHSSHKICCPHLWSLQETLMYTNTHTCMQTRSCLSSSPAVSKGLKFKKKQPFERLAHFVPAAFALLSYWTSCWKITPVIQHLVCFNCIKVREVFFFFGKLISISEMDSAGFWCKKKGRLGV